MTTPLFSVRVVGGTVQIVTKSPVVYDVIVQWTQTESIPLRLDAQGNKALAWGWVLSMLQAKYVAEELTKVAGRWQGHSSYQESSKVALRVAEAIRSAMKAGESLAGGDDMLTTKAEFSRSDLVTMLHDGFRKPMQHDMLRDILIMKGDNDERIGLFFKRVKRFHREDLGASHRLSSDYKWQYAIKRAVVTLGTDFLVRPHILFEWRHSWAGLYYPHFPMEPWREEAKHTDFADALVAHHMPALAELVRWSL